MISQDSTSDSAHLTQAEKPRPYERRTRLHALRHPSRLSKSRIRSVIPSAPRLLFIDQLVSSASNSISLVLAATVLSPRELGTYSLIQLVVLTSISMQRAVLSEPAFAIATPQSPPTLPIRWMSIFPGILLISVPLLAHNPRTIAFYSAACALPLIQDFLRYRALCAKSPVRVLLSDLLWLTVSPSLFLVSHPTSPATCLAAWAMGALVATAPLIAVRHSPGRPSLGKLFAIGKFQAAELALASSTYILPYTIAQQVLSLHSVGAYRFAQTLIGPINALAATTILHSLTQSAHLKSISTDDLRRNTALKSTRLVKMAVLLTMAVLIAAVPIALVVRPQTRDQLTLALPITVLAALIGASGVVHAAHLRATLHQRSLLWSRLQITGANLVATILGLGTYWFFRLDPLVLPTLATPMASLILTRRAFRLSYPTVGGLP